MSSLEREHFTYFVEACRQEYPDLTPFDLVSLNMAAMSYIDSLRLAATQMKSRELVTMSRQHPAVQCRAWMDQLSVTRKARKTTNPEDEDKKNTRSMLMGLSS